MDEEKKTECPSWFPCKHLSLAQTGRWGFTIRRVLKHQALQGRPLRVEPLHQLVGVDWVGQEALGIRCGGPRQCIQFARPAKTNGNQVIMKCDWSL